MIQKRQTTVVIIPEGVSRVRQFGLPTFLLPVIILLLVFGAATISYLSVDYYRLYVSAQNAKTLKVEVSSQRLQIKAFAEEIDTLKKQLSSLNNFEKKIRAISKIEKIAPQKAVDKNASFGIGGSSPEDLKPLSSLIEKHNSLVHEMQKQLEYLRAASENQKDSFEDIIASLEKKNYLLASIPSIRPVSGRLTSPFGYRTSPFTGRKEFHAGIDIACRYGTTIKAPASGVVLNIKEDGPYGLTATINHGRGIVTKYAHLQKPLIKKGDKIHRGDSFALSGNSGRTTGSHLHYEVIVNGIPVNPKKFMLN
ncbi:MAG: M23 family metallopeptidase [Pseudomonadota bacterium]